MSRVKYQWRSLEKCIQGQTKEEEPDFPGGSVVKNPPANAGVMGSIPDPGRSHMPWSNWSHVPQLLTLRSGAQEPQVLSPHTTPTEAQVPWSQHSAAGEAPAVRSRAPQLENSHSLLQLEKSCKS